MKKAAENIFGSFLYGFCQTLHIFMHRFGYNFTVRDSFHDCSGTVYHISGSEDAGAAGVTCLIRDKKTQLKADANGDGQVTFAEIYQYTARRVEYYLSGSEVRQSVQASDPASQLVLFAN